MDSIVLRKLIIKNDKTPIIDQFSEALLSHHVLSDGDDGNWKYQYWEHVGAETALYSNGSNIRSIGIFLAIYAITNDSDDAEWKQQEWTASTYDHIHEDLHRMYSMRDCISSALASLSNAGIAVQLRKRIADKIIAICNDMVSCPSFHDASFVSAVLKTITHATSMLPQGLVNSETCIRMLSALNTSVLEQSQHMITKLDAVFIAIRDNGLVLGNHNMTVTGVIALCNEDILDSILNRNKSIITVSRLPYSKMIHDTEKMSEWLGIKHDETNEASWETVVLKYTARMYELFRDMPRLDELSRSMMMDVLNEVNVSSARQLLDNLLIDSSPSASLYSRELQSAFIGKAAHLVLAECNGQSLSGIIDFDVYINDSNGSCLQLTNGCLARLGTLGAVRFWESVNALSMVFSTYVIVQENEKQERAINDVTGSILSAIHDVAYSEPNQLNTGKYKWLTDMVRNRVLEALIDRVSYYDEAIQSMASDVRNGNMTIPYDVWLTGSLASEVEEQ